MPKDSEKKQIKDEIAGKVRDVLSDAIEGAGVKNAKGEVGGIAGDRLRSIVERIERLEEEKKAIAGDIKEVYAEAKGTGFDGPVLRVLIKRRKMDPSDRDELDAVLDVYERALGMGSAE